MLSTAGDTTFQTYELPTGLFGDVQNSNSVFESLVSVFAISNEKKTNHIETSTLSFVDDVLNIPKKQYELGNMSIEFFPSMTVPTNDIATLILSCKSSEIKIKPENAEDKGILEEKIGDKSIFKLKFGGFVVRKVKVYCEDNITELLVFSTEAIMDIIDKHSNFVSKNYLKQTKTIPVIMVY